MRHALVRAGHHYEVVNRREAVAVGRALDVAPGHGPARAVRDDVDLAQHRAVMRSGVGVAGFLQVVAEIVEAGFKCVVGYGGAGYARKLTVAGAVGRARVDAVVPIHDEEVFILNVADVFERLDDVPVVVADRVDLELFGGDAALRQIVVEPIPRIGVERSKKAGDEEDGVEPRGGGEEDSLFERFDLVHLLARGGPPRPLHALEPLLPDMLPPLGAGEEYLGERHAPAASRE